jgi:hypothetical protein
MTNSLAADEVTSTLLSHVLPDESSTFRTIVEALQQFLTSNDLHCAVEFFDDWACVSLAAHDTLLSFAVIPPEEPELLNFGRAIRLGVELSFGLPSGECLNEKPDTFFYPPSGFTIGDLFDLCRGRVGPTEFTELLNASNRFAMSSVRMKFPQSILLMFVSRDEVFNAGERRFELWTQSDGKVLIHRLKNTNDPHRAALQANELGYWPTIYRCISGNFVAFKSTHAAAFL